MFRVLADLTAVDPVQGLDQTWLVFFIVRESRFHEGLCDKAYIPQLAAISAAHHHAFGGKPHEVLSFLLM